MSCQLNENNSRLTVKSEILVVLELKKKKSVGGHSALSFSLNAEEQVG